jgi:hypothetical protein
MRRQRCASSAKGIDAVGTGIQPTITLGAVAKTN